MKKNHTKVALLIALSLSITFSYGQDQRAIQGATVSTPELHEVSCGGNTGCVCLDNKWCYKPTYLTVRVPNSKWVFIGKPYLVVVEDNQGAAAWNMLDRRDHCPSDRFFITLDNPDEKNVKILSSSRSFKVRIECLAEYRP